MRILQINKYYYRRRGAEAYFLDLCNLLEKNGHEVIVFSMEHPENIPSPYSKYFVSNVDLEKVNFNFKAAGRIFWSFEAEKKIEELILKFKPDIAHVHNIYHQISPSILTTLKKYNIPIVQTLHDYKLLCPNYKMFVKGRVCEQCKPNKYINCLKNKCLKNSLPASVLATAEMYWHHFKKYYEKNIDCFIAPSNFLKNKISEWGMKVNRVEVLPNFINFPVSNNKQTKKYLLYFGGLVEEKGVDILIDIFNKIQYDGELHIVGTGTEEEKLKQLAKNNQRIIFTGGLKGDSLQKEIVESELVLLPSRWYENNPLSVLEAMGYCKTVIAANIGGIPEIIKDQETGILYDSGSSQDLINKINFVLKHPEIINKIGEKARNYAKNKFNANSHYSNLLNIYESLLKANLFK